MIDRTHTGFRCRTQYLIRTVAGNLLRGSRGTVAYEMDNLDRHLIFVNWDSGISTPVFPHEIEFADESASSARSMQ